MNAAMNMELYQVQQYMAARALFCFVGFTIIGSGFYYFFTMGLTMLRRLKQDDPELHYYRNVTVFIFMFLSNVLCLTAAMIIDPLLSYLIIYGHIE